MVRISKKNRAKSLLKRFDSRVRLSEKAQKLARDRHVLVEMHMPDFGRNLQHYTPILAALKRFGVGLRGKAILHVASSTGIFTRFLQQKGMKAVPFDIKFAGAEIAKKVGNKKSIQGDAEKIPFKNNSFDFFVSDNFILSEYWRRPNESAGDSAILEELHRVLKTGGIGVITSLHPTGIDRYNLFVIKQLGFRILRKRINKNFGIIVLKKVH